ncbi:hypothetical protein Ciccas_005994 [Cichlidogyrus casuarinus]|uniref:DUF3719 domain-containing protein n=1 Tax=Cichlidogyrus casuarinus TaxID=1844966 RepID=A0ABD2Q728_9PLAT
MPQLRVCRSLKNPNVTKEDNEKLVFDPKASGSLEEITLNIAEPKWGDEICEFDRQEAKRVYDLFEEIDQLLFDSSPLSSHMSLLDSDSKSKRNSIEESISINPLQSECREWSNLFPHLRLTGEKVLQDGTNPADQFVESFLITKFL